jgi:hypothetical protein
MGGRSIVLSWESHSRARSVVERIIIRFIYLSNLRIVGSINGAM